MRKGQEVEITYGFDPKTTLIIIAIAVAGIVAGCIVEGYFKMQTQQYELEKLRLQTQLQQKQ